MKEDPSAAALALDIARALPPWFQREHRDLAWRRSRDPYAIWVSEIMLQQTRVDTVERYFPRFLERFPDVAALAAADEESVLQAWSGLGYYRRARLLHRGAKFVAEVRAGALPREPEALRAIPGIGAYTAGAIASIAFDVPTALVDGNVARVFSRVRGITCPKRQGAEDKAHWDLAQRVVEHGSPRILAQALMELGALVCTPKAPRCPVCPLRSHCVALAKGTTAEIPAPRRKAAQPVTAWAALAVWHGERLLLRRRAPEGLLGGLWCLPLVPVDEGGGPEATAVRALLGRRKWSWQARPDRVRHVFTHRIWELQLFEAHVARTTEDSAEVRWLQPGELPDGGLPSVTSKLLEPLGWSRASAGRSGKAGKRPRGVHPIV